MTPNEPTVTILILNWDGIEILPRCLGALQSLSYPHLRIIVADNNSQDGSVTYMRNNYPDVDVIELGDNLGFARGNNAAFTQIKEKSEILVLLNNDVYVRPGWLKQLVSPFSDPEVGVTGSKLLFLDEVHIQHAGGELEYPLAIGQHYAYNEIDRGQADEQREVPYVTGASMAIRWSLAEELGLFDERFWPYYFEEVDLCYRVRAAGYKIVYAPASVAIHHETYSTQKNISQTAYAFHRNRLRLVLKHFTEDQLANDFIPAELARLQTRPISAEELEATRRVYVETMLDLLAADQLSERDRLILPALGLWWEASLRVDPEHVPGLIFEKPLLDPLFRKLQIGWHEFSTKVLFWPIVKRQRATNALLWRFIFELVRSAPEHADADHIPKVIAELREELRRIGQ